MIYTNLNTEDMVNELKRHFKDITNKQYIHNVLKSCLEYKLIELNKYYELKEFYKI